MRASDQDVHAGTNAAPRRIVAQILVSLDGVMQGPGGPEEDRSGGFTQGGWTMPYDDASLRVRMIERMSKPHELLLGRTTYEIFSSYWPEHDDVPVGALINRATKHVASRTLRSLDWERSHLLEGDAAQAVARLKEAPGPELRVIGSHGLLQTLLRHDLVDEFDLWMFPVVLGAGKRLFEEGVAPTAWLVKENQVSPTGVLYLRLARAERDAATVR